MRLRLIDIKYRSPVEIVNLVEAMPDNTLVPAFMVQAIVRKLHDKHGNIASLEAREAEYEARLGQALNRGHDYTAETEWANSGFAAQDPAA